MISAKPLPEVSEIVENMKKDLYDAQWGELLRYFIDSSEMVQIVEELQDIKKLGLSFFPQLKNAFRFLHLTPYHKIKMVMLLDATCPEGIPLSRAMEPLPSMNLYKIQKTISEDYTVHGPLDSWCRQGVLMLPCAPTTTVRGYPHHDIWKGFISYILDKVNEEYKDIPAVFMKQKAMTWWNALDTPHKRELKVWPQLDVQDIWNWSNKIIEQNGKERIRW